MTITYTEYIIWCAETGLYEVFGTKDEAEIAYQNLLSEFPYLEFTRYRKRGTLDSWSDDTQGESV